MIQNRFFIHKFIGNDFTNLGICFRQSFDIKTTNNEYGYSRKNTNQPCASKRSETFIHAIADTLMGSRHSL